MIKDESALADAIRAVFVDYVDGVGDVNVVRTFVEFGIQFSRIADALIRIADEMERSRKEHTKA